MTLDNTQRIIATRLLMEKSDKNMEQARRTADPGGVELNLE